MVSPGHSAQMADGGHPGASGRHDASAADAHDVVQVDEIRPNGREYVVQPLRLPAQVGIGAQVKADQVHHPLAYGATLQPAGQPARTQPGHAARRRRTGRTTGHGPLWPGADEHHRHAQGPKTLHKGIASGQ